MQILDHLLISCMATGRHKSSKWAGTFCCHCTEKRMLTATLHVLLPLQWGECSARPWGCGAREAAMPHIWGWVGYLFYNECFPLLLEKCHKSAFEAQKQCSPCTSTWPCSHNAVLLVSVLVHQKDRIMVLASFFFLMELLENGGSVPGRTSYEQVSWQIKLILPRLPGTISDHCKEPDLTLNQWLKIHKFSEGMNTTGRLRVWTW